MTARVRVALLAALLAAAAGCGQQGPLVLPGDARPIERLESPAQDTEPADDAEPADENERARER